MVFLRADTLEGWGHVDRSCRGLVSGETKGQNKLKGSMADKHGCRIKCMMIENYASFGDSCHLASLKIGLDVIVSPAMAAVDTEVNVSMLDA